VKRGRTNLNSKLIAFVCLVLIAGFVNAAAPTGSVTAPTNGTYWKNGTQTITFSVTDTDAPADFNAVVYYSASAGAKTNNLTVPDLNLFASGRCSATTFASGTTCSYSWTLTGVADGNYFIDVELKDLNNADSATISSPSFMIDNTNPTGSISGTVSENDVTLTFSGADAHSGVAKFEVKVDSGSYIDKGVSGTSHLFENLSNGDRNFTLRVTDLAGNQFETSIIKNVSFSSSSKPTAKPEITSDTHEEDEWTSETEAEFEWTTVSTATLYRYALNTDDNYTIDADDTSNGDSRTKIYDSLDDGERWFHAAGCNEAGCGPTDHYRVRVDAGTPGAVSNISGFGQSDGSIYISWEEPDDNPAANNSGIKEYAIYRNKSKQTGSRDFIPTDAGVKAFTGITETDFTDEENLIEGLAYYYRIRAIDNAGNQGPLSGVNRILLGAVTCDIEIEFNVPENVGAGILDIVANISSGTIENADLKIKLPGKAFETIAIDKSGAKIEDSFEIPIGADGTASLLLEGTSDTGADCQKTLDFTIDTEKPIVSLIAPKENGEVGQTTKIIASASDEGSEIKKVEAFLDGTLIGELRKTGNTYTLEWNSRTKANGTYNLEIKAEDNAGNTEVFEARVKVNNVEGDIISEETKTFETANLDELLKAANLKEEFFEEAKKLINENDPTRTLIVAKNGSGSTAVIVVTLKNSGQAKNMQLIEFIPKNIVGNARDIESEQEFAVIQNDPVIGFNLGEVASGEEVRISYTVGTNLNEGQANSIINNFKEFNTPPVLLEESRKEPIATTPLSDIVFIAFIIIAVLAIIGILLVVLGGGALLAHKVLKSDHGFETGKGKSFDQKTQEKSGKFGYENK